MPSLTKRYLETRFPAFVLREASEAIFEARGTREIKSGDHLMVESEDETWSYDCLEQFFNHYSNASRRTTFRLCDKHLRLQVEYYEGLRRSDVTVDAPDLGTINKTFLVFERGAEAAKLPPLAKPPPPRLEPPIVFIGHGRSPLWRDLKDHLTDKHGYRVEAYEVGARAGRTIRDILEEMLGKSSFACLVLTAEDEMSDGTMRARQNVIHEAGLFQGRLGFSRAILMLEEGTEDFSNVHGVQQIRFAKGNIKETFGEVLATLRREFHVEKAEQSKD